MSLGRQIFATTPIREGEAVRTFAMKVILLPGDGSPRARGVPEPAAGARDGRGGSGIHGPRAHRGRAVRGSGGRVHRAVAQCTGSGGPEPDAEGHRAVSRHRADGPGIPTAGRARRPGSPRRAGAETRPDGGGCCAATGGAASNHRAAVGASGGPLRSGIRPEIAPASGTCLRRLRGVSWTRRASEWRSMRCSSTTRGARPTEAPCGMRSFESTASDGNWSCLGQPVHWSAGFALRQSRTSMDRLPPPSDPRWRAGRRTSPTIRRPEKSSPQCSARYVRRWAGRRGSLCCLPFHGDFAEAADAARDGFLAAWYADAANAQRPAIAVHDTSFEAIDVVYARAVEAGADFVVGPLRRGAVTSLVCSDHAARHHPCIERGGGRPALRTGRRPALRGETRPCPRSTTSRSCPRRKGDRSPSRPGSAACRRPSHSPGREHGGIASTRRSPMSGNDSGELCSTIASCLRTRPTSAPRPRPPSVSCAAGNALAT